MHNDSYETKVTGHHKTGVRCDNCGCFFTPEFDKRSEGELEITTFTCPFCEHEFFVSVTDEALRADIEKLSKLVERNKRNRLPEPLQLKMQEMKAANVKRSRELLI